MSAIFAVAGKLVTLFIYVLVGYVVSKRKMISEGFSDGISRFLLVVTIPCLILSTFETDYTFERLVKAGVDAIRMNPATGLPEVDPDKCTACGACVKACPKMIIELRKKWPKNRAVYVSCVSKDKGAVVMKACKAGCIGCGKCQKVCAFGAITIENNLAYIDPQKCKLCRKCVNECPTGAIVLAGMDPLPKVPKAPAAPKASPAAKEASAGVPTAPDAGATPAVPAAETPKAE